jgi:hypothetical protein
MRSWGAIQNEKAPVILVGHGFGDVTIANVAEAAPTSCRIFCPMKSGV